MRLVPALGTPAAARVHGVSEPRRRDRLPPGEARLRYIVLGERVLIEHVRRQAEELDASGEAVEPLGLYAALDASEVAARVGKTRGAINNVFGSQRAFQAATMLLSIEDFLDAGGMDEAVYPHPADFADSEQWILAIARIEAARGPRRRHEDPSVFAMRWLLWLTMVPYGVWSERVRRDGVEDFANWAERLEQEVLLPALDHFGLEMRPPLRAVDLAVAIANLTEGLWISQALTDEHRLEPALAVDDAARNAFLMLWRGATATRG